MTLSHILISPFTDFTFMQRALAACVILAIGGTPLGIFMNMRRMTLVGDAIAHAILPGVALAFLLAGLNIWGMAVGGLATGLAVAMLAVFISRTTLLKEDASFTLVYLLSLAGGITLVSLRGTNVDLMHILFGNILGIDDNALILISGVACLTLLTLAVFYRSLILDCFDPEFMRASQQGGQQAGSWTRQIFFMLLALNLVAAFQALGTLMGLGLIILPALTARFWTMTIDRMIPLSMGIAIVAAYSGLVLSYHLDIPAGPAVVLVAGSFGLLSALCGRYGSVMRRH